MSFALGVGLGLSAAWIVALRSPRSIDQSSESQVGPSSGEEPGERALVLAVAELRATVEQLREEVDRLASRPAAAPRTQTGSGAGSAGELEGKSDGLVELRELVLELGATLERHVEDTKTPEQRAASLQRMMEKHPEANWLALDGLLELHRMDEERARMDVAMLEYASVVERFGKPQLTWGDDKGVTWVYGRGYMPEREAYRTQLMMFFVDGVLARFWVEDN